MTIYQSAPEDFLSAAYQELGFHEGSLLSVGTPSSFDSDEWLNKGDWLSIAQLVGADKIFFVQDNPVIVFAKCATTDARKEVFNMVWCMARPRLLFLASPGQLEVYDLAKQPVRHTEDIDGESRLLEVVETTAEIQAKLNAFRKEQVESGKLFEDDRFEQDKNRADFALIRDLKVVRSALKAQGGLKIQYAHALIGRSIFIRYLEDRGILTHEYFQEAAQGNSSWLSILDLALEKPDADPEIGQRLYLKVLSDKSFTYALFRKLAQDFNGDMFPSDPEEEQAITQNHLTLLRNFLRGDIGLQPNLFFFAYKFNIIPIDLISNIYEEFYHTEAGTKKDHGTHYTPSVLVDFLLSQVLTKEVLEKNPRILDPATGSGIFLVEAFRRIVRYRVQKQQGQRLTQQELYQILRDQIAGIEINPEAIRIAAFSLYLALLNYQEAPDIRQNKRLPHLVYNPEREKVETKQQFDILLCADAFDEDSSIQDDTVKAKFANQCADVVVGNPPWSDARSKEGKQLAQKALNWCHQQKPVRQVGDNDRSQMFIHLALNCLRGGGVAGLLVSSGVLFKSKSKLFRNQWLAETKLMRVVNFAHVRNLFFTSANAPFVSVVFSKENPQDKEHYFEYWSAKKTAFAYRSKLVVLSKSDLHVISQSDVLQQDELWKVYWWGNHRDAALIQTLKMQKPLRSLEIGKQKLILGMGKGFQAAQTQKQYPFEELPKYQELPINSFDRYGKIGELRNAPSTVHRLGKPELFEGTRIIVKRGISQKNNANGKLIARLETKPFCFMDSVYGIKLDETLDLENKVLLGILWSSLIRYYFFMTSRSWGMWHDEIRLDELSRLPIFLPKDEQLKNQIVKIVDRLRDSERVQFFSLNAKQEERELEYQLDEAIFDLYGLCKAERDLVRDLCDVGLDLFYNHVNSNAVKPVNTDQLLKNYGSLSDLIDLKRDRSNLIGYLQAFLNAWRYELDEETELRWQVICPHSNSPLIAVKFSIEFKDSPIVPPGNTQLEEWKKVLHLVQEHSLQRYGTDQSKIYIDGLVRIVSDPHIVIIKRNERRLWTPSLAREDAEATILQVLNMQESMQEA